MKYFFPVLLWALIWWGQYVFARELPLQQISDPACKALHRSDHTEDCKRDFTLPSDQTVFKSNEMTTEKLLFSVLYKWSYHNGHSNMWGHPWVDIVSAKWTPLYAIWDGEVTRAKMVNGFWNTVVIKHTLENGDIIYSNYSHMEKIYVTVWETVQAWQNIWTIGNSWFTMWALGNHIDFQITTEQSPSHPYGYMWCTAWYMNAVQKWLCREQLNKATLEPLSLLKSNRQTISHKWKWISKAKHSMWEKKPLITSKTLASIDLNVQEDSHTAGRIDVSSKRWSLPKVASIKMSDIDVHIWHVSDNKEKPLPTSSPRLAQADTTKKRVVKKTNKKPIQNRKKEWPQQVWNYLIDTVIDNTSMKAWTFWKLTITITDLEGNPINGMLDEKITLQTRWGISSFINEFQFVIWGKKQVVISTQEKGKWTIDLSIWWNNLSSKSIIVK